MLGNLIDFVAPAWTLARRVPVGVYVALLAVGVIGTHLHNDPKRVAASFAAGRVAERAVMTNAAKHLVDSAAGVRAEQSKVVSRTTHGTDAGFQHLTDVAARANAATHALEDSLRALSTAAKADTTVQAVERASAALAATVGEMQEAKDALADSLSRERTARTEQHATDSTALAQVATVAAGTARALNDERKKPKRTIKSTAFAVAGGLLAGAGVVLAIVKP